MKNRRKFLHTVEKQNNKMSRMKKKNNKIIFCLRAINERISRELRAISAISYVHFPTFPQYREGCARTVSENLKIICKL